MSTEREARVFWRVAMWFYLFLFAAFVVEAIVFGSPSHWIMAVFALALAGVARHFHLRERENAQAEVNR